MKNYLQLVPNLKKTSFLFVFLFNYGTFTLFAQQFGAFASAVWMEDCAQTGKFFNVTGTGVNKVNPDSPEGDFMVNHGNFFQNSGKLVFNGGEVKTFKESNSNVCSVTMYYRYYIEGQTLPTFSSLNLPLVSECDTSTGEFYYGGGPCSENDQKWQAVIADYVDLTANSVGNYKFEVYYTATGAHNSTSDCTDTVTLDNSGSYYTAQFSIVANPTFDFTNTTSCGGSDGTISISNLLPNTDYSVSYTLEGTLVGPVTYTSDASGDIKLTGLTQGTYNDVALKNGNNCSATDSLSISDPEFEMLSASTKCNTDGSYNIIVKIRGDSPITVSGTVGSNQVGSGVWVDNGDGTHTWTSDDIASGNYDLTFTNTKNCSLTTAGNDPNCCSFEVTCPTFPATSFECYSQLPIKDTYTEDEFEALGNGDGIIGDNPCGVIVITASNSSDAGTCPQTVTRTYTITEYQDPNNNGIRDAGEDVVLNNKDCAQTLTVQDTTTPTFVEALPTNATVACDAIPTADTLTATDNCGTATVTFAETRTDGNCPSNYTLERTWTATDACGLTKVHKQTLTVQDTTAPTFINVSNLTLACYNETAIQNWLASVTATDNCGGFVNVTNNYVLPLNTCNATLEVQFTAIDNCNNEVSLSKNIIFSYDSNLTYPENTSSVINDMTLATDPGAPNSVIDNCGNEVTPVLVGSSSNPDPILCDGFVVWTYRYTLCDNTTHDWTHTYQVITTPVAPTGSSIQTFCASDYATVADLDATPTVANATIKWYDQAGNLLADSTLLQNGLHYYATQTLSTSPYCESTQKLDVTVVLEQVSPISGNANQEYCVGSSSTVADFSVVFDTGLTLIWYDAPQGENVINSTSLLTNATYYAQLVNSDGCKSLTRFAVQVTLDPDCDDDGVLDVQEVVGDTDRDGTLDYLDPDDDDDELATSDEDSNNNGNWFDDDCNFNDIVDYLDPITCGLIPNVFSPGNGDDKNDTWVIPYLVQFPNFIIEVFDRWGNLIYKYERNGDAENAIKWWDGTSNGRLTYKKGEIVPYGTYFYVINPNDGKTKSQSSWVYLNY